MDEQKENSSEGYFENKEVSENAIKQFCQPCSETERKVVADVFCPTCNEYQCSECSKIHDRFTFMKNHKVVNVKNTSEKAAFLDMKGIDRCDRHGKLIEYFCQDENKLCCSSCAIKDHRKCSNVEDISHIVDGTNGQSSIRLKMAELKAKCKSAAKFFKGSEKRMLELVQALLVRIHDIRTSACKLLSNFEENINLESKTLAERYRAEYSNNLMRCDEIVNDIEHNFYMLECFSVHGTPQQMFAVKHRVNMALESIQMKVRNERLRLEDVDISLTCSESLEGLNEITDKLMSLTMNIEKVNIDSIFDGLPVKLEHIIEIDIPCRKDSSKKPLYTRMDFLLNGKLVALDSENQELVIFNEKLETVKVVSLCKCPLDIITTERDEVAVTYGGRIDIFNVNDKHESDLIRTITDISAHYLFCPNGEDDFLVGLNFYHSTTSEDDGEETDDFDSVDYEDDDAIENDNDVEKCDDDEQSNTEKPTVVSTEDIGFKENTLKLIEEVENGDECKEMTGSNNDASSHTEENDHNSENSEDITDDHDEFGCENNEIDDGSDAEEESDSLTGEVEEEVSLKVCMLSTSGQDENLNVDFPSNKYFPDVTTCAYIKDYNKIVLSAMHDDTVDIYDVATNSCVAVADDRIKAPYGVAIGPYNCIFVCCSGTNAICQISKTGQVMFSHELDMESPWSVCISKDKSKLAVSSNADGIRKLQLFRIN